MEGSWFEFDPQKEKIGVMLPGKMPLIISKSDLEMSYFSGGPGGQNVNRSMNGVRLVFRIPDDYQYPSKRTKVLEARCMDQRSQEQNFKEALSILAEKVKEYFYIPPVRHKTKVPKRSKKQRLADKKRRSELKKGRGHVSSVD